MSFNKLIKDIGEIKGANQFRKYIDFIHFPFYRNLQPNTRITFEFPLTVFVGQNGSGKSSTLHAIQGCPDGYTPYKFWFDTKVDPIQYYDDKKRRHSFFYSFKDQNGNDLEVIKARIRRKNDPNYWETSRPLRWAGMKPLPKGRERNDPIKKKVIYIDFRAELSAFDKYFYFREPRVNLKSKNKQEYLRRKSSTLNKVIENPTSIIKWRGVPQNKRVETLSDKELKAISFILGRKYESGKVIHHKFFDDWGISVVFETDHAKYSEAFAGSGEMAAVRLVQEVFSAEDYSLIILDEPEVSLHPGAQHRLRLFLLEQIKKKKHQVVLSTHSPVLVEGLPNEAVKVFTQNPATGKFRVLSDLTPQESFYHIEVPNPNKKTIIVEDELAKSIVEAVINTMGDGLLSVFDISYYPGGHTVLKSDFIKVFSQEESWNKFVLFDGDQKLVEEHFDPESIPEREITIERFNTEIQNQTDTNIQFKPDSGRNDQKLELMKKYLLYFQQNVFYLPGNEPEEIIWNQELAENHLRMYNKERLIDKINDDDSYKQKFYLLTTALYGDHKQIGATYDLFINYWKENRVGYFQDIVGIIDQIRNA
ncbi:MAG: ATP-binding protein [Bacteroidales bacterium]